jgi:hypothetical protein
MGSILYRDKEKVVGVFVRFRAPLHSEKELQPVETISFTFAVGSSAFTVDVTGWPQ